MHTRVRLCSFVSYWNCSGGRLGIAFRLSLWSIEYYIVLTALLVFSEYCSRTGLSLKPSGQPVGIVLENSPYLQRLSTCVLLCGVLCLGLSSLVIVTFVVIDHISSLLQGFLSCFLRVEETCDTILLISPVNFCVVCKEQDLYADTCPFVFLCLISKSCRWSSWHSI